MIKVGSLRKQGPRFGGSVGDVDPVLAFNPDAYWNLAANRSLTGQVGGLTFTHTRASASGAFVGEDGLWTTVATDEPVFHYDPVTLESLGLRLERTAATNLLLSSEDLRPAGAGNPITAWTQIRASISADAADDPYGTTLADTLIEDSSNNSHFVFQSTTKAASSLAYTLSCAASPEGRDWIRLQASEGPNGAFAYFNVSTGDVGTTGTIGTGFAVTGTEVEGPINGLYRVALKLTTNSATSLSGVVLLADADNSFSYQGDGVSGVNIIAAQLQQSTVLLSYVKTTTATVTRASEVATVADSGYDTAMTLAARGRYKGVGADRVIASLSNGGNNFTHEIFYFSAALTTRGRTFDNGGAAQAAVTAGSVTVGQFHTVVYSAAENDFLCSLDGQAPGTDTSGTMPSGLNVLTLGARGSGGTLGLDDTIAWIATFKRNLSSAEAQLLSAVE